MTNNESDPCRMQMTVTFVRGFTPNGITTQETCPVCGEEKVNIEHGRAFELIDGKPVDTDTCQHFWHCPECGPSVVVVADCYYCSVRQERLL